MIQTEQFQSKSLHVDIGHVISLKSMLAFVSTTLAPNSNRNLSIYFKIFQTTSHRHNHPYKFSTCLRFFGANVSTRKNLLIFLYILYTHSPHKTKIAVWFEKTPETKRKFCFVLIFLKVYMFYLFFKMIKLWLIIELMSKTFFFYSFI